MKTCNSIVPLLLVFSFAIFSGCCCYELRSDYSCCPAATDVSDTIEAPPAPIIDRDDEAIESGGLIEAF